MKKIILVLIALTIIFGLTAYTQRVRISDWLYEQQQEELPKAIEFDDVDSIVVEPEIESPEDTKAVDSEPIDLPEDEDDEPIEVEDEPEEELIPEPEPEDEPEDAGEELIDPVYEVGSTLPATVNLAVPFTSQAPHSNWDLPYQETCEEASVFMVHMFYQGEPGGKIDPDTADAGMLKLVEFQKTIFDDYQDTTALQTSIFAEQFYGYTKIEIMENPTIEDLKIHLAAGRPIIVPSAGRLLGNPNFTGLGPPYHMLVLRGYTETKFITNDPGTRRGEGYTYSYNTIQNAMHDWTGDKDTIEEGRKAVLIIYPEE